MDILTSSQMPPDFCLHKQTGIDYHLCCFRRFNPNSEFALVWLAVQSVEEYYLPFFLEIMF